MVRGRRLDQMRFAVAAKGGADALLQFRGGQQPCRLGDPLLPSQPLGLDRIEPGALGGQVAGEQTDTLPRLLDLAVVLPHPLAHDLAIMQEALSQTNSTARLPRSWARAAHQLKKAIVTALTGRPST